MNKENIRYEKNKRMYVWMKRVEKKVVKRERMREMTQERNKRQKEETKE